MSSESQGAAVAEIAMTLTDKPVPTAVEILAALNRAYSEGWAAGVVAGSNSTAKALDKVILAMSAP